MTEKKREPGVIISEQDEKNEKLMKGFKDSQRPKLEYLSRVITNVVFNLGFIISDVRYFLGINSGLYDIEPDWFYRNGYVIGDIYMRFFFRSMASAPVLLSSMKKDD